jgi:23S rRNA (guanosine2251-2'-O)-methyltransferase
LDESGLYGIIEGAAEAPLVLILDGVQDPHNLGACLRSADGAGVAVVVVPKDRSVTVTDTVRTVACGGAESVPIAQVTNLARTMDQLKELGLWLVGTSDHASQSIFEVDLTGPIGLVMGSEGKGVRRLTSEKCDFLCRIPMAGAVESLNVSVATGVCLYEAVRQRRFKK